ncbi:MAG: hypothetical protein ACI3XR_09045 [Eubacteriales bacterium]
MDDISPSDRSNLLSGRSCLFVDYPEKPTRPDAHLPLRTPCKVIILSGGGMGQRLSLLTRAEREADNRSLAVTRLFFHHSPLPFGVLLGDELCLLAVNPYVPTADCRIMDLHSLADSHKLSKTASLLRAADGGLWQCGESYRLLRSAYLSLDALESRAAEPYLLTDKLDAFALRLIKKMKPPRESLPKRADFCISTLSDSGVFRSSEPMERARIRIALSERPPIAHQILSAIIGQLTAEGISLIRYTDFSGKVCGVAIPSVGAYLGPGIPCDRVDRLINAARFADKNIREIRPLLRSVRQQKDGIAAQIAAIRQKIAGLWQESDEIYESATDKAVFSRFEKDFLIDLFRT